MYLNVHETGALASSWVYPWEVIFTACLHSHSVPSASEVNQRKQFPLSRRRCVNGRNELAVISS